MKIEKITYRPRVPTFTPSDNKHAEYVDEGGFYLVDDQDADFEEYHSFPVIVDEQGVQWMEASLFLLHQIENSRSRKLDYKTLYSYAVSLKDFGEFCEHEGISYLSAPLKLARPPWLYREHLEHSVKTGLIKRNTARRKMCAVANFYHYLISVRGVRFKFEMYRIRSYTRTYRDKRGFTKSTDIQTFDLCDIEIGGDRHEDAGYISDGGRLKPLAQSEQTLLHEVLAELRNPEMTFGFLIALYTGARMQTVYTLRIKHFQKTAKGNEIRVYVGPGTLCDTKGDKSYSLVFPTDLYKAIQVYIKSSRASLRRDKSVLFHTEENKHLFLTRTGSPYYTSKDDLERAFQNNSVADGSGVRQFLYSRVCKMAKEKGQKLEFAFHDLRATFGINFLFKGDNPDKIPVTVIRGRLIELRDRMGHESIKTTEGYVKYKVAPEEKARIQQSYETKLLKDILERYSQIHQY